MHVGLEPFAHLVRFGHGGERRERPHYGWSPARQVISSCAAVGQLCILAVYVSIPVVRLAVFADGFLRGTVECMVDSISDGEDGVGTK